MGIADQTKIKLTHLSSTINDKMLRQDTKYLTAFAKCSYNNKCTATYSFTVKELDYSDGKQQIQIVRTNPHNHNDRTCNIKNQIKGIERTLLADKIQAEHGGSSYEYACHAKAENEEKSAEEKVDIPNLATLHKIKSENKTKDLPSKEWITNLQFVALAYQSQNNFVRSFSIFPQFSVNMFLDKALDILHSIPAEHRIQFMDSSGRLVNIPKYKCSYFNRIMNYFCFVKDLRTHGTSKFRSFCLNEMITSQHDTESVSGMLRTVKTAYEARFNTELRYRGVVMDYSYPSMYAVVNVLNSLSFIKYANKVFKLGSLSEDEIESLIIKYTWIISCCSHTMKRFHTCSKANIKKRNIVDLGCFSFSLLVNSTTVKMLGDIFKIIVIVFYTEEISSLYLENVKKLQALIDERPQVQSEVDKIIKETGFQYKIIKDNDDDKDVVVNEEELECGG